MPAILTPTYLNRPKVDYPYYDESLREPRLMVPRMGPLGPVTVDLRNPIARGLYGYGIPSYSNLSKLSDVAPRIATPAGVALGFDQTNNYYQEFRNTTTPTGLSVLYVNYPAKAYSGGSGTAISTRTGGNEGWTLSETDAVAYGSCNKLGNLRFTVQNVADYYSGNVPAIVTCNQINVLGAVFKNSSSLSFWSNGLKTVYGDAVGNITPCGPIIVGKPGPNSFTSSYYKHPLLFWSDWYRTLSDAEMIDLWRSPFQFLIPT